MTRWAATALATVGLVAAGLTTTTAVAATPTPAGSPAVAPPAEGEWFTWKHSVHQTTQKRLSRRYCIQTRFTGSIRMQAKYYQSGSTVRVYWKNPRLVDPEVRIWAFNKCVRDYTVPRKKRFFDAADVGGMFYGSGRGSDEGCNYNTRFSVGYPWGISASVAPECPSGERKGTTKFQGKHDPDGKVHTMSYRVKGTVARFGFKDTTFSTEDQGYRHFVCFTERSQYAIWRDNAGSSSGTRDKGKRTVSCYNVYDAVPGL